MTGSTVPWFDQLLGIDLVLRIVTDEIMIKQMTP